MGRPRRRSRCGNHRSLTTSIHEVSRVWPYGTGCLSYATACDDLTGAFLSLASRSGGVIRNPASALTVPTDQKRKGDGHCRTGNTAWM